MKSSGGKLSAIRLSSPEQVTDGVVVLRVCQTAQDWRRGLARFNRCSERPDGSPSRVPLTRLAGRLRPRLQLNPLSAGTVRSGGLAFGAPASCPDSRGRSTASASRRILRSQPAMPDSREIAAASRKQRRPGCGSRHNQPSAAQPRQTPRWPAPPRPGQPAQRANK